jgi:hypothetical protein
VIRTKVPPSGEIQGCRGRKLLAMLIFFFPQSPACTSYQMTPQGHRAHPKINPDNYGMDLNSDDSTDDEAHPRKPIPAWARGKQGPELSRRRGSSPDLTSWGLEVVSCML